MEGGVLRADPVDSGAETARLGVVISEGARLRGAVPGAGISSHPCGISLSGPSAGRRLRATRLASEYFVSGVLQDTVLEFVSSPAWPRHLKKVRATLKERRDAMVSLVRDTLPDARLSRLPLGGLHLWVSLPEEPDDEALAAQARGDGLLVSAGSHRFPAEAPGPFLRLSYCAFPPATWQGVLGSSTEDPRLNFHGPRDNLPA